jgi:hypothetical protein
MPTYRVGTRSRRTPESHQWRIYVGFSVDGMNKEEPKSTILESDFSHPLDWESGSGKILHNAGFNKRRFIQQTVDGLGARTITQALT